MHERFWNWKKYPSSVWYLAGPLAVLGFGLHIVRGIVELTQNGDPWFLVIAFCGVALLFIAVWPLRAHLFRSNEEKSDA
jgi:hypothetical protein